MTNPDFLKEQLNHQLRDSLAFFDSELFKTVQLSGIFKDSKTFADAIPKVSFKDVLAKYHAEKQKGTPVDLYYFVDEYFNIPVYDDIEINDSHTDINQYIAALWQQLEKPADKEIMGSLLPLKNPYVVPGGRFRESYYWDSYFTALGLIESNKESLVESMLNNFLDLQIRYGCIPNGNRSYYLSRSQPPILGLMAELILPFKQDAKQFLVNHIKGIETEYKFWMKGSELLSDKNPETMRVVKMPDGSLLNRYWDEQSSPRPESYREDIELLQQSKPQNPDDFYQNIRAACESGWDFSSRWLARPDSLASIRTTRILPIDLNCLLYKQEKLLAQYYSIIGNNERSFVYLDLATARKRAINRYMWSDKQSFFMDYDIDSKNHSSVKSLAGVLPLFVELANSKQAERVSKVIGNEFLKKGGLVTTCIKSSQQWDAPNGWAPLHWFTVKGLMQYQHDELAEIIQQRWLDTINVYFKRTGKIMEKYNVFQQTSTASGGEYDVQEGFGWTNGVYQVFSSYLKNGNE
ncbi:MAG: alpha,alpha-trehalase TreF [Colwellia sp.]|nr:alpha,alpha-trehalase TreF [Colwellia sp.]